MKKKQHVHIMGIVNVTPDSFFDGGKYDTTTAAIAHAKELIAQGADSIDIGGESSRPGAIAVSADEEIARVVPVIQALAKETNIPISIDTKKPIVARKALEAGASIVNDISGFTSQEMIDVAAQYNATICIMHMQGNPQNMQENPQYTDVVQEVSDFFVDRMKVVRAAGIEKIWIDPGIGFGKNSDHTIEIFKNLKKFTSLGVPVLIGTSRKSFIEKLTAAPTGVPTEDRLPGTIASVLWSITQGVSIVRVHDVWQIRQAIDLYHIIQE